MIGILYTLCFAGIAWAVFKGYRAGAWHNGGIGEREAKAEHGRLQRETPNSHDAQLSEAEFIQQFLATKPKPGRYALILLLICFVGLPASCIATFP